jgi:osmotically-inducible protein OsmY
MQLGDDDDGRSSVQSFHSRLSGRGMSFCASATARASTECSSVASAPCSSIYAGGDRGRMTFQDVGQHLSEDRDVAQAVRAELSTRMDAGGRRLVSVVVHQGVVSLTGFVDSYAQKWAVERAAARIVGVRDVRDYLEVLPPNDTEEGRIRSAVRRALEWDARVPDGVHGEVTDGVVRLRGVVERLSEREAAEEAVRNLIGVRDVVNEIRVAHAPFRDDLETDIAAAIRRRFGTDGHRIGIATADGIVTLSGVVPTFAMLEDIEHTLRSIRGVTSIDNQLLVA